eukprot:TRINITY_DN29866_c0_g1_i1.p1 TRINITY_DN29866_c0_g1~~TRINITY_DN29866_c0_g1_i1.p1  ORF type:complete len:828 (+),score=233.01 TRINITY_DN29866_c0_g1_i1:46-2529(+)
MNGLAWGVSLLALAGPCAGGGFGPDPTGVPQEFLCAWRELVYNRSMMLRPDAHRAVTDALELTKYCRGRVPPPPPSPLRTITASMEDGVSVYVDGTSGDDANPGTAARPMKTIQAAVDARVAGKTAVVVRAGTYYVGASPVVVTPETGRGLTIRGEGEVWLSGGVEVPKGAAWKHVAGRVWSMDVSGLGLEDVAAVRADGARVNPARYPNADPERELWPIGYLTSGTGDWLPPKVASTPNTAFPVDVTGRPWDADFANYTGGINGTCAIYDPPFSYWCQSPPFSRGCGACHTYEIPGGLETRDALTARPGWPYNATHGMQLSAWRAAHWANWQFDVDTFDAKTGTVRFGKGGFQGARGGPGSDWFVQNVREELDSANEFYFDSVAETLYMYTNGTDASAPPAYESLVLVPSAHHTLLTTPTTGRRAFSAAAKAGDQATVANLTLANLGFRDAAPTMMQPHGVPSGGDWALERFAAVYMEGTVDLRVENCTFWRVDGNALMLSKLNHRAEVVGSEFAWLGGTAVAMWGFTDELSDGGVHGIDGTGGDFPRWTTVEGNVFREIGVWEKQSSGVFQAKAAETTVQRNVFFNLGRAGMNFNDGFGGGDKVRENVLFNTCRESSDHGPINSWDRQPFITTVRTGKPDAQMVPRLVQHNLLISNYGGEKEVDNDDGSLFWRIRENVMVYGWAQKFKCGGIESSGNLKAFLDYGGKFDAGCLLQNRPHPNLWHDDTLIPLKTRGNFPYRNCWGHDTTHDYDATQVYNNTLYVGTDALRVLVLCPKDKTNYTLQEFQAMGEEPGSQIVVGWPTADWLTARAQTILGKWATAPKKP